MKKHFLLFIGLVALVFASCDLIEDATTVDFETEIETNIPVSSTADASAIAIKSTQSINGTYSFSGEKSFSLASNPDLSSYISNIKSLSVINGAVVTFPSAIDGSISSCVLKYGVGTASNSITFPAVEADASGNMVVTLTSSQSQTMLDFVEANKTATIIYEIIGSANYDVKGSVNVVQEVTVEANALD